MTPGRESPDTELRKLARQPVAPAERDQLGRTAGRGAVFRRIGGLAAVLMCSIGDLAAAQQVGSAHDQAIVGICQTYAAAIKGVPPETGFDLCMRLRGCSRIPGMAQYDCQGDGPQPRHGGGDDG